MGVGARVAFGALGRELFGIVKNAATCASVDSGYLVLFLPPFIIARGSSRAQCGLPRPTAARAATGRCSSRSRRTRVAPRPRWIFAAAQHETPSQARDPPFVVEDGHARALRYLFIWPRTEQSVFIFILRRGP